jgi:dsDNA-binding SOS-regulon protein
MAKINITRLPNATSEYDASQFDQMISLLDQIILLLNTNYQQDLKEQSEAEAFFFG